MSRAKKKKLNYRKPRKKLEYGISKPTLNTYLTFRTSTGKATKKKNVRSTNTYIIEVRSKKTKKIIGYMNDSSLKPMKFKKYQIRKKLPKKPPKQKFLEHYVINFHTKTPLIDQIRNTRAGQELVDDLLRHLRREKTLTIGGVLSGPGIETTIIAQKTFGKGSSREAIEGHLAIEMIVRILHDIGIRASPKKFASKNNKKKKHIRKVTLEVDVIRYDF